MSLRTDEKTLKKLQKPHTDLTELDTKGKLKRLDKAEREIARLKGRVQKLENQLDEIFAIKKWMEMAGGFEDRAEKEES